MAQWSEQERLNRLKAKSLDMLAERIELFKQFRAGGWEINAVEPGSAQFSVLADNSLIRDVAYRVKMPGAHPMRVRTLSQLRRLVKGVSQ